MADARRFIFNSDYPTPYLVYNSGVLSLVGKKAANGDPTTTIKTFRHNLPFTPLLAGVWSLDSDFTTAHDITNVWAEYSATPLVYDMRFKYRLDFAADETYIYVSCENYTSSDVTIYIKLTGFIPPDYSGDVTELFDDSSFTLNSDYVYRKIAFAGSVDIADAGFDVNISHNLGYVPQVRTWEERLWYDEQGYQTTIVIAPILCEGLSLYPGQTEVDNNQPVVDENNLHYSSNNYDSLTFYYHIYGDEM